MTDFLNGLDSRDAFKVCLVIVDNITGCLLKDYRINDTLTNHQFLRRYIPKTKLEELGENLRGNLKFMKVLLAKKNTDYAGLAKRKKKMGAWHDYLTQQHMYYYSQNKTKNWNYLGLSIHYLLDAYYHIFARMTACPDKALCFWCQAFLGKKWSEVLSDVITDSLLRSYLYLNLAHSEALGEELTENQINISIQNMKFLVRESIK